MVSEQDNFNISRELELESAEFVNVSTGSGSATVGQRTAEVAASVNEHWPGRRTELLTRRQSSQHLSDCRWHFSVSFDRSNANDAILLFRCIDIFEHVKIALDETQSLCRYEFQICTQSSV